MSSVLTAPPTGNVVVSNGSVGTLGPLDIVLPSGNNGALGLGLNPP